MKRAITLLFVLLITPFLYSQSTTLSQAQLDKIKDALTRISMADAIVPNIVYNGMTFDEIQQIFHKQRLSIINHDDYENSDPYIKKYGEEYQYQCRVGNYIIFFSNHEAYNPVVLGYAKYGDVNIYYKEL